MKPKRAPLRPSRRGRNAVAEWLKVNPATALGGLIAGAVLAFYFTRSSFFAILGFVFILALLAVDLLPSRQDGKGLKASAVDLLSSLALALALWFAAQFILGTPTPADVVTSCSMLPVLERGDLIILQGGRPFAKELRVDGDVRDAVSRLQVKKEGCQVSLSGKPVWAECTTAAVYDGVEYAPFGNAETIVYNPVPRYYGLIVHRVFLRVTNGTSEVYLTKGDNNLGLDQEAGFAPVPPQDVNGRVVVRVPLIGYLKLFLFMQFDEPPGCRNVVLAGA